MKKISEEHKKKVRAAHAKRKPPASSKKRGKGPKHTKESLAKLAKGSKVLAGGNKKPVSKAAPVEDWQYDLLKVDMR